MMYNSHQWWKLKTDRHKKTAIEICSVLSPCLNGLPHPTLPLQCNAMLSLVLVGVNFILHHLWTLQLLQISTFLSHFPKIQWRVK
jgi:hypothetical protein